MAIVKEGQYCINCTNSFKSRFNWRCELSVSQRTCHVTGEVFKTYQDCVNTRGRIGCDFQPKPPTMWERIKAVIVG